MNVKTPQVSIVIPAYNQAHYLPDAIKSALAQTYRDFEIIVVDDGSTDETAQIAQVYGAQVRYIYQENQGLAGARNTGIRAAQGCYVALLDSDDIWLPAFLQRMMTLAQEYPEATVYYCGVCYINENGQALPQTDIGQVVPPRQMYRKMLRANFLVPSTIVMRRELIMAAGLFDVAFRRLQDWELWVRLLNRGHIFVGLAEGLINYRLHGSSLSTDPTGGQQAAMAMAVKHFGSDDGRWPSWSDEKRRAYGGVYRYHALTSSLLRQGDWSACRRYLRQAFQADPSLANDLDLFYELALGTQPLGQRGMPHQLELTSSAATIARLLEGVFDLPLDKELAEVRRRTYGTAYYALGLVAYNGAHYRLSRRFLLIAWRCWPGFWHNSKFMTTLLKSFVGRDGLSWLRQLRNLPSRS